MSDEYLDDLPNSAKERYHLKLTASGINQCPYKYPAGQWKNDPTEWPNIQWPDVFTYLIDTPGKIEIPINVFIFCKISLNCQCFNDVSCYLNIFMFFFFQVYSQKRP